MVILSKWEVLLPNNFNELKQKSPQKLRAFFMQKNYLLEFCLIKTSVAPCPYF